MKVGLQLKIVLFFVHNQQIIFSINHNCFVHKMFENCKEWPSCLSEPNVTYSNSSFCLTAQNQNIFILNTFKKLLKANVFALEVT